MIEPYPLRVTCGSYEAHPQRVHRARKRYDAGRLTGYVTACGFSSGYLGGWMSEPDGKRRKVECKRCARLLVRLGAPEDETP